MLNIIIRLSLIVHTIKYTVKKGSATGQRRQRERTLSSVLNCSKGLLIREILQQNVSSQMNFSGALWPLKNILGLSLHSSVIHFRRNERTNYLHISSPFLKTSF